MVRRESRVGREEEIESVGEKQLDFKVELYIHV